MYNLDLISLFFAALLFAPGQNKSDPQPKLQEQVLMNPVDSLAQYRMGEILFLQHDYVGAANRFRSALAGNLQPGWTKVWSYLYEAKIFDTTGQRERAVNEYLHAKATHDNTRGAQDEIDRYLKVPYKRK